jgi:hypothetical protein
MKFIKLIANKIMMAMFWLTMLSLFIAFSSIILSLYVGIGMELILLIKTIFK